MQFIYLFLLLDSSVACQTMTNHWKNTHTYTHGNNMTMMWLRHPPFSSKYDGSPPNVCPYVCVRVCMCANSHECTSRAWHQQQQHRHRRYYQLTTICFHRPTTTTATTITDILSLEIRVRFVNYAIIRNSFLFIHCLSPSLRDEGLFIYMCFNCFRFTFIYYE